MVTPEKSSWRRDLLWLALAFGLLLGFRLGSYPFDNPDEGRNVEIPREMLATGDWVTPRLDGVNYFEKPPLMYWAVGASMQLFGPNEWATRAVPALFALGGVLQRLQQLEDSDLAAFNKMLQELGLPAVYTRPRKTIS